MSEGGFTLLEVLVAFAILLLALGVLMPEVSDTLGWSSRAAEESKATAIAQNLLDRVNGDIALADGRQSGEEDGYGWSVTISPYGSDEDRQNWVANPHLVEVTVEWRTRGRIERESFKTIRLGPKPSAAP